MSCEDQIEAARCGGTGLGRPQFANVLGGSTETTANWCVLFVAYHAPFKIWTDIVQSQCSVSLRNRKEVQTELRGRPVRRSAGKTKQNKNSSREWAGRSQSRNRALGFRGAPVPWQTKQRNAVWFWFLLHTHNKPFLVFRFYVWVVSLATPLDPPSFQPETYSM